jgi:alkylation response protein AidB-like acyl-CoA dehydrogenase
MDMPNTEPRGGGPSANGFRTKLPRPIFTEDHELFRRSVRRFLAEEVAPYYRDWERAGQVPASAWAKAGAAGLLCTSMPEEYGGAGADRLFAATIFEEICTGGFLGIHFGLHSEIVAPYILNYGTEAQKHRYLPRMATGEMVGAIAMTEPGGGSDLQAMRTTAIRNGDHYVVNGQKTFISNGQSAGIIVLAVKTDPAARAKGISLLLVEPTFPGFTHGRRLEKLGMHAQDTSELFFTDMRVPAENLLGEEGRGFPMMMTELAWERLQIAIGSIALCEAALGWTLDYTRERQAFGGRVFDFQNTKFKLAELATETEIGRVFVDRCLGLLLDGKLDTTTAAMAKYWTSDLGRRLLDECLQLHGGNGFMLDYPIARAFADFRFQPIAGGSNEVMKNLISRTL